MEALAMLLLPLVFVQSSLAANSSCAEALHTFLAKVFQILDLEAFSHRSSLPYHAPKKFIFSLSPVPQSMQLRTTNATHKTVFICRSVPTSLDILVSSSCILLFQVAPVFDPKDKSLTLELMEISDFSAGCRTPFYSVELWRVIQQPGIALPKDFGSTEYFGKDQHCENPNPDLLSRYISNYVICISLV